MFKNYFKTTLRNLAANRVYSAINIFGLSIGLACCILIFLYAKDELSYDRFHQQAEKIHRITATIKRSDNTIEKIGNTGMMPGPEFKEAIPEIEEYVRVQQEYYTVRVGKELFEQPVLSVDENFFNFFSFPLIEGNAQTVLDDMHSVVLSEELAQRYFGTTHAAGKTLELKTGEDFEPFVVSGVAKKSPQNSSLKIRMLVPMKFTRSQRDDHEWMNFILNTFVTLRPGADLKQVEEKFEQVFHHKAAGQLKEIAEKYGNHDQVRFGLQPLSDMHLSTDFRADNGLTDASNPSYSYILSGIALFIFLIACINFINLTVARSLKRAKEIGIRKVVGGNRRQLMLQFLGESYMLSFIAFALALIIVHFILPFFNTVANKALDFSYLMDANLVIGFVIMFLVTGFTAGCYPALLLSNFNPVTTLYGKFRFGGKGRLSKGLVVFQFTLATFLLIATTVMYSQFRYLINYDLGYNDQNVAVVNTGRIKREKVELFRNELMSHPGVELVSADQGGRWGTHAHVNNDQDVQFDLKIIDENYFTLFAIPVIKGRNFSKSRASDTAESVMVNESFVSMAGWKEPVGEVIDFFYQNRKYKVIGVIRDYHFAALNEKPGPQIFLTNPDYLYHDIFIRLKPGTEKDVLAHTEAVFKKLFPSQPYVYSFKEADNAAQYEQEARWKQMISFGAILTIIISSIGLFGLATLSAEKRTKEIGIRKVFGAPVYSIVRGLTVDFLKLIFIGILVATPIAWYAVHQWLQHYPYRITPAPWMFLFAAGFILLTALLTVIMQALKAAWANPINNLRTE
jgi:putative ABC transport system permease protein